MNLDGSLVGENYEIEWNGMGKKLKVLRRYFDDRWLDEMLEWSFIMRIN